VERSAFTDDNFSRHTFVVIDFEALTPRGRRPEPIEVAAVAVRADGARLREVWRFVDLIKPPPDVPLTAFDITTTGITQTLLDGAAPAATVMAALDQHLTSPPYRLIAHSAPVEAGLIADQRNYCPNLAGTSLLDTVRLARAAYPMLSSHRLNAVLQHLGIPKPADRHRALADVLLTLNVFTRLVMDGASGGLWTTLHQMDAVAGLPPKAAEPTGRVPQQDTLF
jgi:DNA polymerase-3 subunit epsilon